MHDASGAEITQSQDKSCALPIEQLSMQVGNRPSNLNVVSQFKRHRLYEGWSLDDLTKEFENLMQAMLEYPERDVARAMRMLTEKALELHIDGNGGLPSWTMAGREERQGDTDVDPEPVEVSQGDIETGDPEGVL